MAMFAHQHTKGLLLLAFVLVQPGSGYPQARAEAPSVTTSHPAPHFVTRWGVACQVETQGVDGCDGGLYQPRDLVADHLKVVFVADTGNHRIVRFRDDGTFLGKWGTLGTGDGQFDTPVSIARRGAVDVYVLDQQNHRVQVFDLNGNYLRKWGSQGSGDGEFDLPISLTVGWPGSSIWVLDKYNFVQRFDTNGNFLGKWGSYGTDPGQLYDPRGIVVDTAGRVYIIDAMSAPVPPRVTKFTSSGTYMTHWEIGLPGLNGIGRDLDDNIYITDEDGCEVRKFDSEGALLTVWGGCGTGDGELLVPAGVYEHTDWYVLDRDTANPGVNRFSYGDFELFTGGTPTNQRIGAFANEYRGPGRGPWYQAYAADGTPIASVFLDDGFRGYQAGYFDTGGGGTGNLVTLMQYTRDIHGWTYIDVRAPDGSILVPKVLVTNGCYYLHQLFGFQNGSGPAEEIGVGYLQGHCAGSPGSEMFEAFNGSLTGLGSPLGMGTPLYQDYRFLAGDFDNDGQDEVVLALARPSTGAAYFEIWDPRTRTRIAQRVVHGGGFSNVNWVVGDFDDATPGVELLAGSVRESDGAMVYTVWDEYGLLDAQVVGLPADSGTQWQPSASHWHSIRGTSHDLVLVGFTRKSDGRPGFQVWDPATGALVVGKYALGPGFTPIQWVTANFDGNAANGDEMVLGFRRDDNNRVGFIAFDQAGAILGVKMILSSSFPRIQFLPLQAYAPGRDDLLVGALRYGAAPVIQVWRANGVQLLQRTIFHGWVKVAPPPGEPSGPSQPDASPHSSRR
jgi:hypothetical protein